MLQHSIPLFLLSTLIYSTSFAIQLNQQDILLKPQRTPIPYLSHPHPSMCHHPTHSHAFLSCQSASTPRPDLELVYLDDIIFQEAIYKP